MLHWPYGQRAGGGGTGVVNLQSGCRTPAAALQSIHSAAAFIRRQKPTTRRQSVNRQTSVLWLCQGPFDSLKAKLHLQKGLRVMPA
ncbi:hypothetical protein ABVT39_019112 [Epinephelus coioides]